MSEVGQATPHDTGWTDDLGRAIQRTILSFRDEQLRSKGKKPVPIPVQDQILRGAIVLSIASVFGLFWRYMVLPSPTVSSVLQFGFICFQLTFIGWFVISFIRRRSPSIQIPKRLARGECPGCLYELAGLPPERIEAIEAAIRCPECGAVWRAERVGRPKAEES
ncbi:MAG: hypothetical protein AAFV77_06200 [Planctomycetota bacterium]